VYVSDYNNHRVQKFDSEGNFITKWGSKGTGDGEFVNPNGIAMDSSGNVYVADAGNNRIQVFAPDINPSIIGNGGKVNGKDTSSATTGDSTTNSKSPSSITPGNTPSNNENPTPTPSLPAGITDQA
jgi:tripartite motif-containing protein 71